MKPQVNLDKQISKEVTKISMVIDSALLEKIKAEARERNLRTQELIEEALNLYLQKK